MSGAEVNSGLSFLLSELIIRFVFALHLLFGGRMFESLALICKHFVPEMGQSLITPNQELVDVRAVNKS